MAKEVLQIEITANNKSAVTAFNQVQKSAFNLKLELEKYQSLAFTEKDRAKVAAYNRRIQELQTQLKNTTNIGKQGFDEMGVAIKGIEGPIGKSFSILRNIAYIVPGLGIAGIFNLAFEAIGKAVDELDLFAKKEDLAAKSAKELNDEILKSREGAEGEVSKLKALAEVASNTALSNRQRLDAVKQLRDQYPGYFKDLTNEQILTGNITAVTDSLTRAIYARAEARAREADIAKKATQVFENQNKLEELNKKIQETNIKRRLEGPLKLQGGFGQPIPKSAKLLLDEYNLIEQKDKILTENSRLQLEIAQSQLRVNSLTAQSIILGEKEEKTTKKKVKALKEYHQLVGAIREPIMRIRDKETERDLISKPPTRLTAGKNGSGVFDQDITEQSEKRQKALDDYTESLMVAAGFANIASTAMQSLFDNMDKGMSIGESLGSVFGNLAKQIAQAAIKAAIFSAIFSAITGGASAATKGTSKGSGGFFGLFKGLLGFATGGTVSGPKSGYPVMLHGTEHIVRPDQMNKIVGGAAQMGQMMSNQGQTVNVVGKISGMDIWLSKQRTDYFRGLTT